ncbi:MAG TPA: response regulator [Gemmataceae bacterium]|nr:response regulator [Gemmataceae bacterium]
MARLEVLIAEDNTDGAESLAHILEYAGYSVRVVYDGQAAVAAALIDPPDIILMDIGLPRMDGWQAARRIYQGLNGRRCLMVALTGYDRPEDRRRSWEAGFQIHLAKPVDPDTLLSLLDRYRPSPRSTV